MRLDRERCIFLAIALLTALIQAVSIRPGSEWLSDDYAAYIHGARSLLTAGPFAMPGYVPDLAMDAGPGAYPPGFPVLLTPGVALFGTDLVWLRIYNLAFAASCVFLFMLWLRPVAGLACTAAIGALVGLSPFIGTSKEILGSEFACYSLLWLWLLLDRRLDDARPGLRATVLTALPLAAAILTRIAVGSALVARPLADLLRHRRIGAASLAGLAAAALFVAAGLLIATPDIIGHYAANITVTSNDQSGPAPAAAPAAAAIGHVLQHVRDNGAALFGQVSIIWSAGPLGQGGAAGGLNLVRKTITLVIVLLGFAGLAVCVRRGPRTADVFFVLQLCSLLILPSKMTSPRLYMMLSMLLIYYAVVFATSFQLRQKLALAVAAFLVAGSIPSWVAIAATPPDRFTVYEPRAQAFLEWVRTATPTDAVLLTHKPRAVTLFTGRGTSDWHHAHADAAFFTRAAELRAEFIVFYIDHPDPRQLDRARGGNDTDASLNQSLDQVITAFMGAKATHFQEAYRNQRFRAFRIAPTPG